MDHALVMKRIVLLLILIPLTTHATLTVTSRGTVTNNSSASTFVVSPTSTIAAGSIGVVVVVTDNATGTGQAIMFSDTTKVDSVGNTWTRRQCSNYDPGANGAGTDIGIFTATITTQVTSSDNLTLNLATATTPKVAAFWQVSGSVGSPAYKASGIECDNCTSGNTGTSQTYTSASITNTNAVIFGMAEENTVAITGDSDTTNGSWSASQTTTAGSGATGQGINSQSKVVTATATQTYDTSTGATSVDWNMVYVEIEESLTSVKTVMDLAKASVKTGMDLAVASVKSWMGLP